MRSGRTASPVAGRAPSGLRTRQGLAAAVAISIVTALGMSAGLLGAQPDLTDQFIADGSQDAPGSWSLPDGILSIGQPQYAFAQTPDSTPPTFVSSGLDSTTGVLTITFSETIDVTPATNVVPTGIHIRESGSYTGGTTLSAGELGTTADGTTISFTLTDAHRTTVAGLTTPELTIEPGAVRDTSGNFIVGTFDVSTAAFVDDTPIAFWESFPEGMAFSNDGLKMFVIGSSGDDINEYNLTAAFDASTRTFVNNTSVSSEDLSPEGMAFSNDGLKMFVVGAQKGRINEYNLTAAFDVSTAAFVDFFAVGSQDNNPGGMAFSNDGLKMFVVGDQGNDINEYALTTAFDVSTASFVSPPFSVSSQDNEPQDMAFSNDGTKMFVVGIQRDRVNEYALTTAFDVSTAAFVDFFAVGSQESFPRGMAFSNDGTKMFVTGSSGDDINEYTLSSIYPVTVAGASDTTGDFITTWLTASANQTVTIPGTGMYTVNWGDGSTPTAARGYVTHTYATADTYTVSISGNLTRFNLSNSISTNYEKLQSIVQWGNMTWSSMKSSFEGTYNMMYRATDAPDLSGVTDMSNMFAEASLFDGNLSAWDVSTVETMEGMFSSTSSFNGDISTWDVLAVTDMGSMFRGATAFNQDISGWDVSAVTDMESMFRSATAFNQDISGWDVSSATNMGSMFAGATLFTQNLGKWYVVPADTSYSIAEASLNVTTISAQNPVLKGHNSTYGIGGNSPLFNMTGSTLMFKAAPNAGNYAVNVTATGSSLFENGNNWRTLDVTVTGQANVAPVLNSIGSKSVNELVPLTFTATATDGDGDTLTFSLTGTPPTGAAITDAGAFSWTPTESHDGPHTMTIRVEDGNGGSASETITVTVNEVNMNPVLASVGSKSVNELVPLTFTATATDDDIIGGTADTLTFSLETGAPTGASITSAGAFSWTPTERQDGAHSVTVQVADDNGGSASETIIVTVNEVNVAPTLNMIGSKSVAELVPLTFTASASDRDFVNNVPNTLTFSLTGTPPTGAAITDAGAFSWTPTASQAGTHDITFQVADSTGAIASEVVTVTVSESNENPVLASIGSKSVNELVPLTFTATATDGDGDTLTFSLTGTPPTGAAITDAGAFSWTPTESHDGPHTMTIRVEDGNGGSASETITVTVNEVNMNPVLASVGSKSVNELVPLTFTATATDDDIIGGTADTLTFSLETGAPAGASISSVAGAFSWRPTELQDGIHVITIRVQDGNGGSNSENVTVTVGEVNVDPVLNPIGSRSANHLEPFSFTATATDDDIIGGTPDTLTFSMTGNPAGASLDSVTGTFSWTPTASQTGPHDITFQVADGTGAIDSEIVTVTVSESNENPVLASIGSKSVNELVPLSFTASATDGDGDTLTFSLVSEPSGASIHQNTGTFSWTPTESQDGPHSITVRVSDGSGGTDSETVMVTVGEVNVAPTLDSIGSQGVNRPGTLAFTATAIDDDVIVGADDVLTFSMTGAPAGASLDSVTGTFSWTPAADQTGAHTITVIVTDGADASDSEVVEMRVTEGGTNAAPVLDSIGSQEIDELDTLRFLATATDDDGDSLMFTLTGNRPRGASITSGGSFEWTPDQSQDGPHSITVQVSDGRGGTASQVVDVMVIDIAPLPLSARASSSAITLTLSETVVSGGQGPNGFSVMTGGDLVSVESITGSGTATLTLNLNGTVSATDGDVKLSYLEAEGDVADLDEKPLASFSDLDVSFSQSRSRSSSQPPAITPGSAGYPDSGIPKWVADAADLEMPHGQQSPIAPIPADETFDFPLVINGYGYLLDDATNTLVPQTVRIGDGPTYITFTVYTQRDLAHFTVYLNLQEDDTNYAESDTYIAYKNDGTTSVTDPHGYIDNATITVTQEDDSVPEKKTVRITVEFEEPMGHTNMVAYMWDTNRKATLVRIIDAFEVTAALLESDMQTADPEPVTPDFEPVVADTEPVPSDMSWPDDYDEAQALHIIRMWSGFEAESITDAQLIELLGLEAYQDVDLPDWMMTELGVLVARGDITVDEFMLALQYVLTHA